MLTSSAVRSLTEVWSDTVQTHESLHTAGWTASAVYAQLNARRWQLIGRAIVRHNGPPTRSELCMAALINHGPRAVLTSFTSAEHYGLTGWERSQIHVLVPAGARIRSFDGVRTHWVGDWNRLARHAVRPLHSLAPALVVAAASFRSPRPACGILAAGVQQRLVRPDDLTRALLAAPRARHRAQLILAVHDITEGAQALSEIDFRRLCSRHGIPLPLHQAVRRSGSGKRRYLDAEWRCRSGRRLVVEVDGAVHLAVQSWVADQLRQNEIVVAGDPVLRYPSVVVRTEEDLVADQLRRSLDRW